MLTNKQDCAALGYMRDAITTNQSNLTNWMTATAPSTWSGITLGGGRVYQIDIGRKSLSGTLASEIAFLKNLQTFYSYANQFSGTLPSFSGLTNLVYFDISYNQLTGILPSFNGTDLTYFYIHSNQFSGTLPSFSGLTGLLYFYISFNHIQFA